VLVIVAFAIVSSSRVETPGAIAASIRRWISDTIRLASRMRSTSPAFLMVMPGRPTA
jgi:hypothetical protein